MRTSLAGTTLLAAVAATTVVPGTAVAAEDTESPKISGVSAPRIVGMTSKGATFAVNVKVSDNIDVDRVVVGLIDEGNSYAKPVGFPAELVSGMSWDGTYRAKITMPTSVPLGGWKVSAFAQDTSGNKSGGVLRTRDEFTLKLATRFATFNAGPEPVTAGETLKVRGKLKRAVADGWAPLRDKRVRIKFRADGTKKWTTAATVTTNAKGGFRYAAPAEASGAWRAIAAGDRDHMRAKSGVDAVRVR